MFGFGEFAGERQADACRLGAVAGGEQLMRLQREARSFVADLERDSVTEAARVHAYLLALGAPLLLIFAAVVRDRLDRAGASHLACSITQGTGAAFAITVLVGAGIYAAVPAAMTFSNAGSSTSRV